MIHNLGGSTASFANLLSDVVELGRTPVAMDLPGVGHSDPLENPTLTALVEHMTAVVNDIAAEPVDIIGRGFGGYLALTLAAREPARYRRLVIHNPLLPADGEHDTTARMRLTTAANGALTTMRGGRIKQNVSGLGRASVNAD